MSLELSRTPNLDFQRFEIWLGAGMNGLNSVLRKPDLNPVDCLDFGFFGSRGAVESQFTQPRAI